MQYLFDWIRIHSFTCLTPFFSWKFGWAGKNACMIHSFFFCSVCFLSVSFQFTVQQYKTNNFSRRIANLTKFVLHRSASLSYTKIKFFTVQLWVGWPLEPKKMYCFYWHARTVIGVFDIDNFLFSNNFFYHINWNRFGSRKQKFRFWYIHILWLSLVWAKFVFFFIRCITITNLINWFHGHIFFCFTSFFCCTLNFEFGSLGRNYTLFRANR